MDKLNKSPRLQGNIRLGGNLSKQWVNICPAIHGRFNDRDLILDNIYNGQ